MEEAHVIQVLTSLDVVKHKRAYRRDQITKICHCINAFQDMTLKETKRSKVLLLKWDLQHEMNVHFLLQQQLELLLQEHPDNLKAEEE